MEGEENNKLQITNDKKIAETNETKFRKAGVKEILRILRRLDLIYVWPILVYRRLRYEEAYRRIYLGNEKYALVSWKDFYRLRNFKWIVYGTGSQLYAITHIMIGPNKTKTVYMHREIMNHPAGLVIDHRNNVGLDNRRSNLRPATHAQNMYNCRKRKNTSSRFLGVYFNKEKISWDSQLMHNGERVWVGRFKDEVEAARAYDRAAIKYHGEYAHLNFPREDYVNEIRASQEIGVKNRPDIYSCNKSGV